jgi:hypothetical protein
VTSDDGTCDGSSSLTDRASGVCESRTASRRFDDPNFESADGLAPVWGLAERAGLPWLAAGMVAGASCIDDMDLLHHGGMGRLSEVRAPTTLGATTEKRIRPKIRSSRVSVADRG